MTDDEVFESRVSRMFFAGLSSATALFITHPLDVIKLNVQVKPLSIREVIRYHYVKDKGITRIYKGILASMSRSMVYCNLRFELYELAKRENLLHSFQRKIIVSSISGGIGGFFVTPLSKVHVRTQNDELLPPDERNYKGLFNGLNRIYREEGLRLMFAGAGVSSLRGMMSSIGQIALYDEAKYQLLRYPMYFKDNFTTFIISSVAAGFIATLLQQPFEVVHVKLMSASPEKYKNSADVIKETARNYGIVGFYKGLILAFVRIVPQTVITYMILENLRLHFGELIKSRKRADVIEIISEPNEDVSIFNEDAKQ